MQKPHGVKPAGSRLFNWSSLFLGHTIPSLDQFMFLPKSNTQTVDLAINPFGMGISEFGPLLFGHSNSAAPQRKFTVSCINQQIEERIEKLGHVFRPPHVLVDDENSKEVVSPSVSLTVGPLEELGCSGNLDSFAINSFRLGTTGRKGPAP